jgi:aminoglycoside phosphotransferase (APT) family kinase protein
MDDSFEAVLSALHAAGRIGPDSTVRRLSGGVSSFIAVVDDAWVAKAARQRLDVQAEWIADPRRAHREGIILRALGGRLGPVRVPGVYRMHDAPPILELEWIGPPAVNWKTELLAGRAGQAVVEALAEGMAVLHERPVPPELAGPDGADAEGAALFDSLRLDPYYRQVAADRPEHAAALAALIADCTQARPARLVHGDFTPKNVLVTGSATSGPPVLLDWEVIHVGDPAFDLGMLAAHLLLKACLIPALWPAARALARAYRGPADPARAVRHAGAIMLARLWGKSRVEYLTAEPVRVAAAAIGGRTLHGGYGTLTEFLDDLPREVL